VKLKRKINSTKLPKKLKEWESKLKLKTKQKQIFGWMVKLKKKLIQQKAQKINNK
jgi:hypothetical protein